MPPRAALASLGLSNGQAQLGSSKHGSFGSTWLDFGCPFCVFFVWCWKPKDAQWEDKCTDQWGYSWCTPKTYPCPITCAADEQAVSVWGLPDVDQAAINVALLSFQHFPLIISISRCATTSPTCLPVNLIGPHLEIRSLVKIEWRSGPVFSIFFPGRSAKSSKSTQALIFCHVERMPAMLFSLNVALSWLQSLGNKRAPCEIDRFSKELCTVEWQLPMPPHLWGRVFLRR